MVVCAFVMIVYGFIKYGYYKKFAERINAMDLVILGLALVYFLAFLRNPESYTRAVKIESAFMMYFMGRIYAEKFSNEIAEKTKWIKAIPITSYVIVYANMVYKLYIQISFIVTGQYVGVNQNFDIHADGALYYYKTDMVIGIVICLIFIYALSEKKILKWVTIIPVGIFMAFYQTSARTGQLILLCEYLIIAFVEIRKRGYLTKINLTKKGVTVISAAVMLAVTTFLVFIQVFPPMKINLEDQGLSEEVMNKLNNLFHSRHLIWWDALSHFVKQNLGVRLIGIDLISEGLYNPEGDRFHNLYFKQIFSVGYAGTYLFYAMLCMFLSNLRKEENDVVKYIAFSLMVMLLLISISMEGLEYTQMTWYPFIFMGMLVKMGDHNDKQISV